MEQCLTNHDGLIDFIQKQRGGFEIKAKIDDYLKAYYEANSNIHQEIMHAIEEICLIEGIDGFHSKEFLSFKEETTGIENPQLEYAFSYILYLKSPNTYPGSLPNKMRDDWYDDTGCDNSDDYALRVIGIARNEDDGITDYYSYSWNEHKLQILYDMLIAEKHLIADSFNQFRDFFDLSVEKPDAKMRWLMMSSNDEKYIKGLLHVLRYVCRRMNHPLFEYGNKRFCSRVDDFFALSDDEKTYNVDILAQRYSEVKNQREPSRESESLFLMLREIDNIRI